MNFVQTSEFDLLATERLNLPTPQQQQQKIIISSEAKMGMKLKLYRNVHNIGLYEICVFYCRC